MAERRKRADMIETFKIIRGPNNAETPTWTYFQKGRNDGTHTRNSSILDNLKTPPTLSKNDIQNDFFSCRDINYWNELPNDLKSTS